MFCRDGFCRGGETVRYVEEVLERYEIYSNYLRRHPVAAPEMAVFDGDGTMCGFLGSAVAAVLRAYTTFEGAVLHEECRAAGADRCVWRTTVPQWAGRS